MYKDTQNEIYAIISDLLYPMCGTQRSPEFYDEFHEFHEVFAHWPPDGCYLQVWRLCTVGADPLVVLES